MNYDLVKVEECGRQRMDIAEMCEYLGYDEDAFRREMQSDKTLKAAFTRGKSTAIYNASKVVNDSYMNTKVIITDGDEFRLKAALEFLKIHSRGWRKSN